MIPLSIALAAEPHPYPLIRGRPFLIFVGLGFLLVVGLHFIIMGVAHGPLMALLGVASVANALLGLRARALPIWSFGGADGLLKFGFGLVMLLLYPALTFT